MSPARDHPSGKTSLKARLYGTITLYGWFFQTLSAATIKIFGSHRSLTATKWSQLIFFSLATMMFHFAKKRAKLEFFSILNYQKSAYLIVIVTVLRAQPKLLGIPLMPT